MGRKETCLSGNQLINVEEMMTFENRLWVIITAVAGSAESHQWTLMLMVGGLTIKDMKNRKRPRSFSRPKEI